MTYKWIPVLGQFKQEKDDIIFKGGMSVGTSGESLYNVGNYVCDQIFGGGVITGEVEFIIPSSNISSIENDACEFILYYHPLTQAFTTAGIGSYGLCTVRTWAGAQWITHGSAGDRTQLKANRPYKLSILVKGSNVTVTIDDVNALVVRLPYTLPQGQPGIWCYGKNDIRIKKYQVKREPAKVFVVMQFTPPYNELYIDVIQHVCEEFGLVSVRADESYGPGLIVADIAREITEAKLIIADITPANPNVYYEVGYAHALNKPTILIAEKPTQLPFDVSPYRVLFYENTIGGKSKVESGLRKHLDAILTQWSTGEA